MHVYWIFVGARNSIQSPVQRQKHCSRFQALTKLFIPLVPVPHTGVVPGTYKQQTSSG